jgi:hypothetical protein
VWRIQSVVVQRASHYTVRHRGLVVVIEEEMEMVGLAAASGSAIEAQPTEHRRNEPFQELRHTHKRLG